MGWIGQNRSNADLTEPQEVTPSLIFYTMYNNPPPKGEGVGKQNFTMRLRSCNTARKMPEIYDKTIVKEMFHLLLTMNFLWK